MEFVLGALIAGAPVPITQRVLHRGGDLLKGAKCVSEIKVKALNFTKLCPNCRFLAR